MEPVSEPNPHAKRVTVLGKVADWQWLMGLTVAIMGILIAIRPGFNEAFLAMIPGLGITLKATAAAFIISSVLGLAFGLGRVSKVRPIKALASYYIEFVRGVPFIVWVFFIALFIVPRGVNLLPESWDIGIRDFKPWWRGTAALSLFYAAFIAEVVRAGIQSVDPGQVEAGRSVGLSERQVTRRVVLPQAIRNVFPAFANDLIALFKDTALLSVIAVSEITQLARLYQGVSFKILETFLILMVIYVVLTFILSSILNYIEKRIAIPGRL